MIREICLNIVVENILEEPMSKVTPGSYHVFAHLHSPTNGPYQLPTPYSFQDVAGTRLYRSWSLQQG